MSPALRLNRPEKKCSVDLVNFELIDPLRVITMDPEQNVDCLRQLICDETQCLMNFADIPILLRRSHCSLIVLNIYSMISPFDGQSIQSSHF